MKLRSLEETGTPHSIGLRIKAARLALGYKVAKEFALTFGATGQQLSNYEKGANGPSIWHMRRLCQRHRISLDWIYMEDPGALPYDLGKAVITHHKALIRDAGPRLVSDEGHETA